MSRKIFIDVPDRYGHIYQLGIDINTGSEDKKLEFRESRPRINWERKESAHIILEILSKLDIAWMRDPKKLLGWGEDI